MYNKLQATVLSTRYHPVGYLTLEGRTIQDNSVDITIEFGGQYFILNEPYDSVDLVAGDTFYMILTDQEPTVGEFYST